MTAASDRHGHERDNDALIPIICSLRGESWQRKRRPTPTAVSLSTSSSSSSSSSSLGCCCNSCQNSVSSSWMPRIAGPALLVREMAVLPYAIAPPPPPPRNVDTLCSEDVVERRSDDVDDQNAELSDADGTTMRWCPVISVVGPSDTRLSRGDLARLKPVDFVVVVVVVVAMLSLCVTLLLLRRLRLVLLSSLLTELCVCLLTACLYLICASFRRLNHATWRSVSQSIKQTHYLKK